jgi:hypothetical protein
MRIVVAFLALGSLSGAANAASVFAVAPAEQPENPSIVTFGASSASPSTALATTRETSGSSIVTLGEPVPGPADDKVSAIGDQGNSAARGFAHIPMVIRGGIVGDAFVRAASAGPSPTAAPVATADSQPKPEAAAAPSSVYQQPAKSD